MAIEKSSGSFAPPPAGAPQQVSSSDIAPTPEQVAAAQANARELAPFNPTPLSDEQIAAMLGKTVEEVVRLRAETMTANAGAGDPIPITTTPPPASISSFKGVDVPLVKAARGVAAAAGKLLRRAGGGVTRPPVVSAQEIVAAQEIVQTASSSSNSAPEAQATADTAEAMAAGVADQAAATVDQSPSLTRPASPVPVGAGDPVAAHAPAFSNSESPTRGVPKPIADRGKQITGGFGAAGEASYYPLDGLELRAAVEALLGDLQRRIQDDLRFSIAVVYPRVTARVVIEVQAYAQDGFQIPKVYAPAVGDRRGTTPIEIAKQHGDEIVFCVVSEIQEMTDEGESVAAPNAIREELGIEIPQKQWVGGGVGSGGRTLVDVTGDRMG